MIRTALALSFALACGGGGNTAPVLSNMVSPATVPVATDTLQLTFDFESSNDLKTIELILRNSPAGPALTPQPFDISNTGGVHHGTVVTELQIQFKAAGQYDFGLDVIDSAGLKSNELDGTLTAQ